MKGQRTPALRKKKVASISEEAYEQLGKKYGFTIEQLRRMATELQYSRPKLEAHLIVLAYEAKKKL